MRFSIQFDNISFGSIIKLHTNTLRNNPCGACLNHVGCSLPSISCNSCTTWFHLSCTKVTILLCFVLVFSLLVILSCATFATPRSTSPAQIWQNSCMCYVFTNIILVCVLCVCFMFCVFVLCLCSQSFYLLEIMRYLVLHKSYTEVIKLFLCLGFLPFHLSCPCQCFCPVQVLQHLAPPFNLIKDVKVIFCLCVCSTIPHLCTQVPHKLTNMLLMITWC